MHEQTGAATEDALELAAPMAYVNWRRHSAGDAIGGQSETRVIGDSRVVGEITDGLGPYKVLNPVLVEVPRSGGCVIVVRAAYHGGPQLPPQQPGTQADAYHAGPLEDEICSLLSLELGIRLKAGAECRAWYDDWDGPGMPRAGNGLWRDPVLLPPRLGRPMLPELPEVSLHEVSRLHGLIALGPEDACALVRCARAYQDALWLADAQPELSWLLLVSAVETAAAYCYASDGELTTFFADAYPELTQILEANATAEVRDAVIAKFGPTCRAGWKFRTFLLHRVPAPPPQRPMETFQVVWSDASLGAIVRTLYGHRSKALHEGRPFPLPMCVPPFASDGVAMERPFALSGMGGQWAAEDRPIHLHVFAYWVRHALLMWWDEMIDTGSGIEDATPATPAPPS